jgi:hypothetical protein
MRTGWLWTDDEDIHSSFEDEDEDEDDLEDYVEDADDND